MVTFWSNRVLVTFAIFLFLTLLKTEAVGASAPPTLEKIKDRVDSAVYKSARTLKLGVDPQLSGEMLADAVLFFGNFCFDDDTLKACSDLLDDGSKMREVITAYLEDSKARPPMIRTIASRLSTEIGRTMSDVGWPSQKDNSVGVINVPVELQNSEINLYTATGRSQVGGPASALLMSPGSLQLVATLEDKTEVYGSVELAPRGLQDWIVDKNSEKKSSGAIDVTLESYCARGPEAGFSGPLAIFNWGRRTIGESAFERDSHLAPSAHQIGLDISVEDQTGTCSASCSEGLGIMFAEAVAIWRSGCARCRDYALSVIRVGDRVWMDRRLIDRLHKNADSLESTDADTTQARSDSLMKYLSAPSVSVPQSLVVGYVQVTGDADLKERICLLEAKEDMDWIAFSQGFLCPESASVPEMELHPKVVISKGWTDCEKDAIACAIPGGNVQITTAEYAYEIPGTSGFATLGESTEKQKYNIRPIILHEVGHWFGVPHPEAVGAPIVDIMSGVYNPDNECVSAESLSMLNNAADDRWEYRAKDNQGLLPQSANQKTPLVVSGSR